MVTRLFFLGFLGLLALQRLLELRHSQNNEAWMLKSGGIEHFPRQFKLMKLLHASWFLAMIGEVFFLKRDFVPGLAGIALLITGIGQSLRYAAIRALGRRWTVRIVTLPNSPAVTRGIYKYFRHPNYVGVILEFLAVPLLHSAFLTSIVWSILNALLLTARIRCEERALVERGCVSESQTGVPRFVPFMRVRKDAGTDTLS